MKIEYAQKKEFKHFGSLEIGTVFCDSRTDTIYMKTESIADKDDKVNAVDLATGELDCFYDGTAVYVVNATLYIKEG